MLEGSAENISMENFQKAIKEGVNEGQKIISAIKTFRDAYGQSKREIITQENTEDNLSEEIISAIDK